MLVLDGTVERGKEEVLQDGVVVVSVLLAFRVEILQNGTEEVGVKDFVGHKVFLLDEPNEHDARYHAYHLCLDVFAVVVLG